MDRILELELATKDYFIESDEFLFSKKFVNRKKKVINLVLNAYNIEYNLILKDYIIFFENKLKTKIKKNTTLVQKSKIKKHDISKFFLYSQNLNCDKFFKSDFDLKDITIRPNAIITFKVSSFKKKLSFYRFKLKKLNKKFFYQKALEIL